MIFYTFKYHALGKFLLRISTSHLNPIYEELSHKWRRQNTNLKVCSLQLSVYVFFHDPLTNNLKKIQSMFYLILEKEEEVKTSHVRRRSMRCKKFPVFSSLLNNSRRLR